MRTREQGDTWGGRVVGRESRSSYSPLELIPSCKSMWKGRRGQGWFQSIINREFYALLALVRFPQKDEPSVSRYSQLDPSH